MSPLKENLEGCGLIQRKRAEFAAEQDIGIRLDAGMEGIYLKDHLRSPPIAAICGGGRT